MKYLLLILTLFACQPRNNSKNDFLDFPSSRGITGERSEISDQIFQAFEIIAVNNQLIVSEQNGGHLFKIFDLENQNVSTQFGKIGQGPCEFEFPTSIQVLKKANNKTELGLFNRRRWIYQALESGTFNCISNPSNPLDFNFQKVILVNDSTFFGIGIFKNKYAVYHRVEKGTETLNIPYPFQEGRLNLSASPAMNQQGDIHLKPDGSRILVTSIFSPFFDIIDSKNFSIIKRIEGWPPSTNESEDTKVLSTSLKKDNKFGYISSAVTENNIYLLFLGKNFDDEPYASNTIHIYDWEGNKLEQLNLSTKAKLITISENDTFLYTYHDDGKANILTYRLK